MLSPITVADIEQLLAAGQLSYRQIARRMGVGHSVVGQIALGRHRRQAAARQGPTPPVVWQRCPGCGGRVQMPCRLCHVRRGG